MRYPDLVWNRSMAARYGSSKMNTSKFGYDKVIYMKFQNLNILLLKYAANYPLRTLMITMYSPMMTEVREREATTRRASFSPNSG